MSAHWVIGYCLFFRTSRMETLLAGLWEYCYRKVPLPGGRAEGRGLPVRNGARMERVVSGEKDTTGTGVCELHKTSKQPKNFHRIVHARTSSFRKNPPSSSSGVLKKRWPIRSPTFLLWIFTFNGWHIYFHTYT
jgi:hypothetical protein